MLFVITACGSDSIELMVPSISATMAISGFLYFQVRLNCLINFRYDYNSIFQINEMNIEHF